LLGNFLPDAYQDGAVGGADLLGFRKIVHDLNPRDRRGKLLTAALAACVGGDGDALRCALGGTD
jgi:hypothetical protein